MRETLFFPLGKIEKMLTPQAKYQKYFLTFGKIIKPWFQIFDVLWRIPENSLDFNCSQQKDARELTTSAGLPMGKQCASTVCSVPFPSS